MVKEFEREERDVVMLVLDASVELWAGAMGQAPLDDAIDTIATLASVHLGRGDLVGLRIVSTRELAAVAPAAGRSHASEISRVLAHRTGVLDADRSAWDEAEVAAQVSEHMRPLEPKAATDLRLGRLDRLVKRASAVRAHAPFTLDPPYGRSDRDVRLRSYAASFGMHFPARLEPDRPRSCQVLADTLGSVSRVKPSVSMVHVVAPVPTDDTLAAFRTAMRRLRGQRVGVRWSTVPLVGPAAGGEVGRPEERSPDPELAQGPHLDGALFELLDRAVRVRVTAAQRRGERALRGMGVKLVAVGRSARHDDAPRSPRDAA